MLTYLKIGIITELICKVTFLVITLLIRIATDEEFTKEYLDNFDIRSAITNTIVTIFVWPVSILLKILYLISGLKH